MLIALKKPIKFVAIATAYFAIIYLVVSFGFGENLEKEVGVELQIDMSLSAAGGAFEVYVNNDFHHPRRVETTHKG